MSKFDGNSGMMTMKVNWELVARYLMWGLLALVLLRMAWVCDDAFITFRTLDNAVRGHGLVYNVGERVQAFTHPLWALIHLPFQYFFRDPYWSTIFISWTVSLAAAWTLARGLNLRSVWLLLPLALISSKAFIEFSSSGLENPLSALLIVLFAVHWLRPSAERSLVRLSLLAALVMVTRMDLFLMVAPALAWACWERLSWQAVREVALGMTPFLLWELFSIIYYGFPFPNTAYAKLGAGVETATLAKMGLQYYLYTLTRDPATLPIIFGGLVLGLGRHRLRPLAAGLLLYLIYIVRIGGDFMGGRFFMVPFVMGVLLLAYTLGTQRRTWYIAVAAASVVALLGFRPMILFWQDYDGWIKDSIAASGIADERAYYADGMAAVHALSGRKLPDFRWMGQAEAIRQSKARVHLLGAIGLMGYYAGPENHIIDEMGLSDPLLARLPARYESHPRVGHYPHTLPPGYWESVSLGQNVIIEPTARQLYDHLSLITRGPIFSNVRLKAIWKNLIGTADLPSVEGYRVPTGMRDGLLNGFAKMVTLEVGMGGRYALPQGGADSLAFTLAEGPGVDLIWMKGGIPLDQIEVDTLRAYVFAVPQWADTVAIVPNTLLPETRVDYLRAWRTNEAPPASQK